MNTPSDLKYTKEHEWVKMEGNIGAVGITDYAQGELGDVIYLDITKSVGDEVEKGESIGSIEAVKTVSEVYSPIDGKILEINSSINDNPSIMNTDPYGEGWIIKIEMSNTENLDLLDVDAYKNLIGV